MKWSKRKNSFVCALLVMALVLCSCASSTEEASTKDEAVAYSELTQEDFETISYVNQNSDMVFELMGEMQGISDPMEGPHEEWSDDVECGGAYVLAEGIVFRTSIKLKREGSDHHILGIHCGDQYKNTREKLEKAGFEWKYDEVFNSYLNLSSFTKGNVVVLLWVTSDSPYEKEILDGDLIQEVDIYIPMYHDETDTRMTE